jgi:predicted secreted acid phosphatase
MNWDNEQEVLERVKQDGNALYYASKRLQDNEKIVLEAVKQYGYALYWASKRLQDNEKIVLEAVKQDGETLYHASERLQNQIKTSGLDSLKETKLPGAITLDDWNIVFQDETTIIMKR